MNKNLLLQQSHGGDFYHWNKETGIDPNTLLDFSVNVRPDGMPDFLKSSIIKNINNLARYPSPHAEELKELCAKNHGLEPDNFVFGNGSNELFQALCAALFEEKYRTAYIAEPAFSEYRFSLEKAGIEAKTLIFCLSPQICAEHAEHLDFSSDTIQEEQHEISRKTDNAISALPANSLVFLANPANPSGFLIKNNKLMQIIAKHKDRFFVLDEAFIEYSGEESLLDTFSKQTFPPNLIIVRSLTKFYALAGIRLGYLACNEKLASKIQNKLPAWNVNSFAIALAKTLFTQKEQVQADSQKTKQQNFERKLDLYQKLSQINGIKLYASWANYILFSLERNCPHFWQNLLTKHHISIRNCANYLGLENKNCYRAAVRFPAEHTKLCNAIANILHNSPIREKKKKPSLMLLGTSSNAGKSVLTAGFCRIFTQDGYTVRPFKAQNMSLNSGVTVKGEEMGRAQIVQAKACNAEPDSKMNPILLKPQTDMGSQIIALGKPIGTALARDYYEKKSELWEIAAKAYDELAEEADIMVLEGAGSPAEINLKEHDIVNLKMAEYAQASTLLVGDIDRGGVYASFLGTWQTFTAQEEKLFTGFLVNRFRGDSSLLAPAHEYLEHITGKKILGVIPFIKDIALPEEDMAGALWNAPKIVQEKIPDYADKNRKLDIALIMFGKISNHTDFEPLALEKHCLVRPVYSVHDIGSPDLIILGGSKSVAADLEELKRNGLFDKILELAKSAFILGICGGLQMLGKEILDPEHIETEKERTEGFNLLPLSSTFHKEKQLTLVENVRCPLEGSVCGYEIHHGKSEELPGTTKQIQGYFLDSEQNIYGYTCENVWASYIHGLFDNDVFRLNFINHVRAFKGLNPVSDYTPYTLETSLNKLADVIRKNVDMDAIYQSMGLASKKRGQNNAI